MTNRLIAQIFDEIAVLLELQDANPFRIRAYRRASSSLQGVSEDVESIAQKSALNSIPGIGPDLAAKIQEYLKTGRIKFHEDLRKKTPPFLLQMLEIPGVGPKTAKVIFDRFRPKNFDELHKLASSGKISRLPRFREKTEQNILQGIEFVRKHHGRTLLGKAVPLARRMVDILKKARGVSHIAYAGSVRRKCETIRDIDILIASRDPEAVMNTFVKMKDVMRVLAHGSTKSSVITREGIQIDLRVVAKKSFGAALLYFTGSKAHNILLRSLAKRKGCKISEYGLLHKRSGKSIGSREEDIYRDLGLAYIPPELREDQGEIEAAGKRQLPKLVELEDVRGDLHVHSDWSDGSVSIENMVESARKRGLQYVVLTDHSVSLRIAHGLSPRDLFKQVEAVRKLNKKLKGITVLTGSEVDILSDGSLDYKDDVLSELDFVVAAIHSGFKQSKREITQRLIRAMRNKHVHLIGHPTGRLFGERDAYEVDFDEVFKVAVDTNTALEINSHPERLDLNAIHAKRAKEMGVMIAVTTDSHAGDQFNNLEYGIATARRAWCTKKDILNCLNLAGLKKRILK